LTCTKLTTIPYTLFDNNLSITTFDAVFRDCTNLTGVVKKYWDDSIWTNITTHINTFTNTGALASNGATIPTTWGGTCNCNGDCSTNCNGDG